MQQTGHAEILQLHSIPGVQQGKSETAVRNDEYPLTIPSVTKTAGDSGVWIYACNHNVPLKSGTILGPARDCSQNRNASRKTGDYDPCCINAITVFHRHVAE